VEEERRTRRMSQRHMDRERRIKRYGEEGNETWAERASARMMRELQENSKEEMKGERNLSRDGKGDIWKKRICKDEMCDDFPSEGQISNDAPTCTTQYFRSVSCSA